MVLFGKPSGPRSLSALVPPSPDELHPRTHKTIRAQSVFRTNALASSSHGMPSAGMPSAGARDTTAACVQASVFAQATRHPVAMQVEGKLISNFPSQSGHLIKCCSDNLTLDSVQFDFVGASLVTQNQRIDHLLKKKEHSHHHQWN